MDRLTKEKRSWNMSRITSKNTGPEIKVRSFLHKEGFRFTLNRKNLPGSPDIVLPRYKCVVFVHGCFWHRHSGCKYSYTPKSRVVFWNKKFSTNVARDKQVQCQLRHLGWSVIVLWECEIKNNPSETFIKMRNILRKCLSKVAGS